MRILPLVLTIAAAAAVLGVLLLRSPSPGAPDLDAPLVEEGPGGAGARLIGRAPADGGPGRVVAGFAGYQVMDATVSPDGATILFTSNRSGNQDIWSVPFAGGDPTPVAASPLDDQAPRFSPNPTNHSSMASAPSSAPASAPACWH